MLLPSLLFHLQSLSPRMTHVVLHTNLSFQILSHSFLSFSGKGPRSPFPHLSSFSAPNLASAPVQFTVTTWSKAPSNLQTAKYKAPSLTSICVDDPSCTSLLASLPDSQTEENYFRGPPPAYKLGLSFYVPYPMAPPPNQSSKRGTLQDLPLPPPLPCVQPMALLWTPAPKCPQSSSPVHAHTTTLVNLLSSFKQSITFPTVLPTFQIPTSYTDSKVTWSDNKNTDEILHLFNQQSLSTCYRLALFEVLGICK